MGLGPNRSMVGLDAATGVVFVDTTAEPIRHLGILLSVRGAHAFFFFFFFFFFSRVSKLHERDRATKATPHSSGKRMAQPGKHHPVRGRSASPTTWEHERRFAAQPA